MQNISLRSSGMRRKQKLGLTQQFWLLLFAFLLPSFFAFLASFFFFCLAFSRLHFGGKAFRKAFRISGLDERKGRWVVEQDFHGNFQLNVKRFFAFFSGVLDWIVLILVWFERYLHSTQVSGQIYPWPFKLMTSQVVQRSGSARAVTGGSGANWLRYKYNVVNEVLWLWRPKIFFLSQYMLVTVKLHETELRKHLFICSSLLTS